MLDCTSRKLHFILGKEFVKRKEKKKEFLIPVQKGKIRYYLFLVPWDSMHESEPPNIASTVLAAAGQPKFQHLSMMCYWADSGLIDDDILKLRNAFKFCVFLLT